MPLYGYTWTSVCEALHALAKQSVKLITNFVVILLAKITLLLEHNIHHGHLRLCRSERLADEPLITVTIYCPPRYFATDDHTQPG
jgi:hypothetical protein